MFRIFALCLGLLTAAPAAADFVLNNLRYTLYHELGHAVIDQLAVPVFGPEEDAADSFGLTLANRLHTEEEMRDIIRDMTTLARQESSEELFDPWGEYMPGPQRLSRAICLWFGLNPDARGDLARALGMPEANRSGCADYGRSIDAAWSGVFRQLAPKQDAEPARMSLRPARRGKMLRLLGDDIERVNDFLTLPRTVPVRQVDCGEDNAFYYQIDERIDFCAEMIDALRARKPG
jgi:hypothetical protein